MAEVLNAPRIMTGDETLGEADGGDDLRRLVRTHHKHGADLIKVMSTGGFMTAGSAPWYAQFTIAELTAVVEEASRLPGAPRDAGLRAGRGARDATTEAADALGLGATTGRLAPGYAADVIIVDGDPAAASTSASRHAPGLRRAGRRPSVRQRVRQRPADPPQRRASTSQHRGGRWPGRYRWPP
jgi:cytosine/adenosine deaminase-related metal-dependent hydrolase